MIALAIVRWSQPSATWLPGGAMFYLLGTLRVTLRANVRLNHRLATFTATDAPSHAVWRHYLQRWM